MMREKHNIAFIRGVIDKAAIAVGPVENAGILPPDAYISEEFFAFEKEAIFQHEWLCVGHVNEVPKPGDHLPLQILDEPVVFVRDLEGVVRVLSAICQHRGHPMFAGLAARPADKPCLNGNSLICPYHNWTYLLDGRLVGAPSMQETTPVSELRKNIRLPELRSEIFHGLVFITFDADAPPLAPRLKKLDSELSTYPLETLVPASTLSLFDLKWNWKLHHENALEPYHTDYVHKGYHNAVPSRLTQFRTYEPGDGQVMRTTGFEKAGSDLFEQEGGQRLPGIDGLTEEQYSRVLFVSLMPNVVAVIQPTSVTMTIINPLGAGAINSRRINLYPRAAVAHPEFERIMNEQFERNKILIGQDQTTLLALQKAYQSRYTPRGTLSRLESSIPQLSQWAIEKYRNALARYDAEQAVVH